MRTSGWLLSKRDAHLLGIRYQPKHDAEQGTEVAYHRFLRRVMDTRQPGKAWLRRDPVGETSLSAMEAEHDGYLALPEALGLINELDDDLQKARLDAEAGLLGRDTAARLAPLRHRIYIDSDRFNAVAEAQPAHKHFCVVLDFRFSARFNQLHCHASVSVWSAPPLHRRHRPELVAEAGAPQLSALDYRRVFEHVAQKAQELLMAHLFPINMYVLDGEHTMPVFWVAMPSSPPVDPMDYLDSGPANAAAPSWVDWTNKCTEELLGLADARDSALTRSVLNGDMLALRRAVRREDTLPDQTTVSSIPTYLLLPARHPQVEEAEFAAASLIIDLTDLEAEAANLLHLPLRNLEIWGNHLKVYNAVIERGAFLWDALSTHLMIRWGTPFERAHNAVDMLHQVLQQAVADLRHIATLTDQAVAGIEQATATLQDGYDQCIGERNPSDEPGLRKALTETQLLGRATRLGSEVKQRADRVKTAYDDLLKAISGAFDERRVRELDGTQKAGFFVGFFAALIGLVAVLDATVNMKPDEGSKQITILGSWIYLDETAFWASIVLGVVVLVLSVTLLVQVNSIGKLGTRYFRHLYHGYSKIHPRRWWGEGRPAFPRPTHGLWRFLKDTSTDHQKRLRQETKTQAWKQTWSDHDRFCAEELVAIWDEARNLPDCRRHEKYRKDIKGLSRLIEQWGVHSLVLTERARVMHWFDLPNLTCLYRCCTLIKGSFLDLSDLYDVPPVMMVADIDMLLSLTRLGFTRGQARSIDNWLTTGSFSSAASAYERVRKLGLRVGMDSLERQETLDLVKGSAKG